MHKCTKCGQEFEGNFCPECGTKWVDPELCPKCGARHGADAKFCPECGKRLEGNGAAKGIAVTDNGDKKAKLKSYLALGGIICISLAALMGLIFTFCTGVTATNEYYGIKETKLLYYFFKDYLQTTDKMCDAIKVASGGDISTSRELGLYLPAVLCLIISALGILGVVCVSAFTAYRAYKKYFLKEEANVITPAVAVYLIFALVATLLLSIMANEEENAKITFSEPTLGGLITGGIFLGAGVILFAVTNSNKKSFIEKDDKTKIFNVKSSTLIELIICVLSIVVLVLIALPAVSIKISDSDGETEKGGASPLLLMRTLAYYSNDEAELGKIFAYGTIGGIAGIALAVCCVVMLHKYLCAFCNGKSSGRSPRSAIMLVAAALYLAFSIRITDCVFDMSVVDEEYLHKDFAVPIAIVVISAIALVAEIVEIRIRKKDELHPIVKQ